MTTSNREHWSLLIALAICIERLASRLGAFGTAYRELEEACELAGLAERNDVDRGYLDNVVRFKASTDRVLARCMARADGIAAILGTYHSHPAIWQTELAHLLKSIQRRLGGTDLHRTSGGKSLATITTKREWVDRVLDEGKTLVALYRRAEWLREAAKAADQGEGDEHGEAAKEGTMKRVHRPATKDGWIYKREAEEKYAVARSTMQRYRDELAAKLKEKAVQKDPDSGQILLQVKYLERLLRRKGKLAD